jgi:hypothetical protein
MIRHGSQHAVPQNHRWLRALGVVVFVAIVVVIFLLVQGGAWLADKVYPILIVLFVLALLFTVLILLPLAIFRKTRGFAAMGVYITSYIYGLTVWDLEPSSYLYALGRLRRRHRHFDGRGRNCAAFL